ncbi:MAG: aminodeoxychorismate lyase [Woeseiaceae bacterium]|nr:aminodeoxychorismate lyase [Woeseiaceae bacterium]
MSDWSRNGQPVDTVAIDDRAFQYGDGLFETVAIRDGQPRLWPRHLERLARGCGCLGIDLPDIAALSRWIQEALWRSAEDPSYCIAKIVVSSGAAQRGYGRERRLAAETYVGIYPGARQASHHYRDGVDTVVCDTRLALHSVTAGLKTLNRLEQVLAGSERIVRGAFEGLTLDADGRLICGTMSNVFIVSGNRVMTPALQRCGVAGVMRAHAIESLQRDGITVDVCDVAVADLWAADEVFLANSQFGVLPVRRCDERVWHAHPVTARVMSILASHGIEECAL